MKWNVSADAKVRELAEEIIRHCIGPAALEDELPWIEARLRAFLAERDGDYAHRSVPMEGRLDFKFERDGEFVFPAGTTSTKTGVTALYALHSTLEALSGQQVRITVEWDDSEAHDGQEPERSGP